MGAGVIVFDQVKGAFTNPPNHDGVAACKTYLGCVAIILQSP
jgi:hypothetical protein